MHRRAVIAVIVVCAILPLALLGCGGGSTFKAPGVVGAATFVGRAVCAVCHAAIDAQYSTQNHGLDFRVVHGDQIDGYGGACAPCHSTGFGEASGFVLGGSTPHLEGIGCEECHGPGSKHAAAPSHDNINRVPRAEDTCWDCHVPDYKMLRGSVGAKTDVMLANTAPGSVAVHHPQATFLLGKLGYNLTDMPGPHRFVDNTCTTCHLNPDPTSIPLQVGAAAARVNHNDDSLHADLGTCTKCHSSDLRIKEELEELEEEINKELIEIGGADPLNPSHPDHAAGGGLLAAYAVAHGIDLTTNADPTDRSVRRYKAARWNYMYVIAGIAVHNPPFAEKLIEDAKDRLSR